MNICDTPLWNAILQLVWPTNIRKDIPTGHFHADLLHFYLQHKMQYKFNCSVLRTESLTNNVEGSTSGRGKWRAFVYFMVFSSKLLNMLN